MECYRIYVVDSLTERRIGRLDGSYTLEEVREIERLVYQHPDVTSIPEPVRVCRVELCRRPLVTLNDVAGRGVAANSEFARVVGVPRDRLVGMTPFQLTSEAAWPSIEALLRSFEASLTQSHGMMTMRNLASGEWNAIECTISRLPNGLLLFRGALIGKMHPSGPHVVLRRTFARRS